MRTPILFSIEILDQDNPRYMNINKGFSTNTPRVIINTLKDIIKEIEESSAEILKRQVKG